jgi:hypothetical protein
MQQPKGQLRSEHEQRKMNKIPKQGDFYQSIYNNNNSNNNNNNKFQSHKSESSLRRERRKINTFTMNIIIIPKTGRTMD